MFARKIQTVIFGFLAPLFTLVLVYLLTRVPTHEGHWGTAFVRLPEIRRVGRQYRIRHVRDFRYKADGGIAETRYQDQSYPAKGPARVWLGLSHFAGFGMAHSFLSFEFEDGRYLVASVEARLRPGQRYAPVQGLFRRFHKMVVLGTEADIIGLRSHVRRERVLLYPLELNEAERRGIFIGVLRDVKAIQQEPAFYNTLLDNCTTSLLRHDPHNRFWRNLLDYRILLPGHADGYALQRGWLEAESGLTELRSEVTIDGGIDPREADFSGRIRNRKAATKR